MNKVKKKQKRMVISNIKYNMFHCVFYVKKDNKHKLLEIKKRDKCDEWFYYMYLLLQ